MFVVGMFDGVAETAFATIASASGFAGSVGFFVFPHVSRAVMGWWNVVAGLVALAGYLLATRMHNSNAR